MRYRCWKAEVYNVLWGRRIPPSPERSASSRLLGSLKTAHGWVWPAAFNAGRLALVRTGFAVEAQSVTGNYRGGANPFASDTRRSTSESGALRVDSGLDECLRIALLSARSNGLTPPLPAEMQR